MRMRQLLAACALAAGIIASTGAAAAAPASAAARIAEVGPVAIIRPGEPWGASNIGGTGTTIQAHTPSVLKTGSEYYMLGTRWGKGNGFIGVECYASATLGHWAFRGTALAPDSHNPDLVAGGIVQRPQVIYNASRHTYVMWMRIDNAQYTESRVGVAISTTRAARTANCDGSDHWGTRRATSACSRTPTEPPTC